MTCTTFLNDSELNLPFPYPEVQNVLDDVRKVTKLDWQIVPLTLTKKTWYGKVTHETFYGLYVYVGGVVPWQRINFFNSKSDSSISFYVTIEEITAYLMGTLNGAEFFVMCMENKP